MNRIDISDDERFIEVWHNGQRIYTVSTGIGLHNAVGQCRQYVFSWAGEEATINKTLKDKMDAADSLFMKLAFAGDYR